MYCSDQAICNKADIATFCRVVWLCGSELSPYKYGKKADADNETIRTSAIFKLSKVVSCFDSLMDLQAEITNACKALLRARESGNR